MFDKYSPRIWVRRTHFSMWGNRKSPKYCTPWVSKAWSPQTRDSIAMIKADTGLVKKLQNSFLIHPETVSEEGAAIWWGDWYIQPEGHETIRRWYRKSPQSCWLLVLASVSLEGLFSPRSFTSPSVVPGLYSCICTCTWICYSVLSVHFGDGKLVLLLKLQMNI